MPKKLLFIIYSMSAGGAERVMSYLVNHYAPNHEVYLLTLSRSEYFFDIDPSVKRISLDFQQPSSLLQFWKKILRVLELRRKITEIDPDKIISFLTQTNTLTLAANLFLPYEVVISERSHPKYSVNSHLTATLRRWLYPTSTCLVVQTPGVKHWYEHNIRAVEQIQVIANPNPFTNLENDLYSRINHSKFKIILVGRLVAVKRFDLIIDCVLNNSFCYNKCEFEIFGDGPLYEDLSIMIKENGLNNITLKGRTAEIQKELVQADIYVLCSSYEGFPNTLLEAMSIGLPCISANCEFGPTDLIDDGKDGILFESGDYLALGRAIETLCTDTSKRELISKSAVSKAKSFDLELIMTKWDPVVL